MASPIPETVRAFHRDFANAPDLVALPNNEADIAAVLDWAAGARVAVIPFGGGSSVVGGVEPVVGDTYSGAVSLDMRHFDRVLEVDATSRAARIQGGIRGPKIEAALKPHGLAIRHYPQSFEFSTLGGWIATRSGGHFATLYTHIDDFVESIRTITPAGAMESRRLPGSGAGPSPDRMMIGSEGALGIITEAWMRLQGRPRFRADAVFGFRDFFAAARAVRAVAQAGLFPSNLRVIDNDEAGVYGVNAYEESLLVLAFESADHPVDAWMARAVQLLRGSRRAPARGRGGGRRWRTAFIRMPYARELTVPMGLIDDTFETAITWDRFEAFHAAVRKATEEALKEATGHEGTVSTRFTHVYPDGPALYYTFNVRGAPRPAHRAMALDQDARLRRADCGRRHDHPPSRGRPRPHALVPRPAPRPVRQGVRGGEKRARSGGDHEPGGLAPERVGHIRDARSRIAPSCRRQRPDALQSVDLKGLHIFDDRPALLVGEADAEFVASIAVAVRVRRIGHELTGLERQLVDVVAYVLRIEDTAADHEARFAFLSGLHRFPQVRHRAVVKIGRDRPDAIQYARLVSSARRWSAADRTCGSASRR